MTQLARRDPGVAAQLPGSRSAVMPALHAAQERYGWLPPEAFEEVAEALDLTPAYCMSSPASTTCTTSSPSAGTSSRSARTSPARSSAPAASRGVRARARRAAGETTEDGEFTLRTVECARRLRLGAVVAIDNATASPSSPRMSPRCGGASRGRELTDRPRGRRRARPDAARRVPRRRRLRALERARATEPDGWSRSCWTRTPRSRRRGLPHGPQGELHPEGRAEAEVPRVNADESEPGTFKDREIIGGSRTGSSRAA